MFPPWGKRTMPFWCTLIKSYTNTCYLLKLRINVFNHGHEIKHETHGSYRYTRMCVSFRQYTPLENSMTNRTNTLQNPQTKRDLCKIWGILSKWFEKISNCCVFSMCFCYFIITHTLREKAWPIIFTELNSFFSMDVCFYLVWFKRILWFWRSVCLFVDIVFV